MHQKQNHLLINISSKGGLKHPICQPLGTLIKSQVALENCQHNNHRTQIRTIIKDESIWPSTLER